MANLKNRLDSKQTLQIVLAGVPIELAQVDLSVYTTDQLKFLYVLVSGPLKGELDFVLDMNPGDWTNSSIIRILRNKSKANYGKKADKKMYLTPITGHVGFHQRVHRMKKHIEAYTGLTGLSTIDSVRVEQTTSDT